MAETTCPKCHNPALAFDLHLAGVCCECIKAEARTLTNWQSHPQRITNPEG